MAPSKTTASPLHSSLYFSLATVAVLWYKKKNTPQMLLSSNTFRI